VPPNVRTTGLLLVLGLLLPVSIFSQNEPTKVVVDWNKVTVMSKTAVSLEVDVEPPMLRTSPVHARILKALRDLNADYARLVTWYTWPKLGIAEMKPPENGKTYWDFSLMDEYAQDFMEATEGHPVVVDFSTIPEWMFKTKAAVTYPEDPNQIDWDYEQGTELRDPTMKEVADYFGRVASWYTKGGFNDEFGEWHASGHHYQFAYWEVLNEADAEHSMTPAFYTRLYDAIVERVRQVSPEMKFAGLALAKPLVGPEYFQYFLDPKNHKAGISIDMITYHFYSMPDADETPETMQYTTFNRADDFLTAVRYIESIRKRFSPHTLTYIDELGTMLPGPTAPNLAHPIPDSYWNLSGGMWAYIYGYLAQIGTDLVAATELIDYPGMFAASSLVSWESGQPNARYWVSKLLRDDFGPGDKLVETELEIPEIYAQAFITPAGRHEILLVNKRDRAAELTIPGAAGGQMQRVDQSTGSSPPLTSEVAQDTLTLPGLAVAVLTLPK